MAVPKFCHIVFASLLLIQSLNAFNLEIPSTDPRIKLMLILTKNCFPDIKANILVTDSPNNSLVQDLYTHMLQSRTIIDNSKKYRLLTNQNTPFPQIILILTSPEKHKTVFAKETWRDFNQFFIILDGGNSNGCVKAGKFLMEAWKNDILNVVFLCLDHQVPKLFSFNPFTSSAPKSWKKVFQVPGVRGHPWTLLIKNFDFSGHSVIFFDKLNDLGGYPINAVWLFRGNELTPVVKRRSSTAMISQVAKILAQTPNGTLKIKLLPFLRIVNKSDTIYEISNKRKDDKKIDFYVNYFHLNYWHSSFESMYPFLNEEYYVSTVYRVVTSSSGQMFTFLPLSVAVTFLVASIIIFLLLRYVFKDPYSRDLIDSFRVYLNFPLPRAPRFLHGQIVFGVTLVVFAFANTVIQSYMDTVLTTKNVARNIENIDDLIEFNYTVYTWVPFMKPQLYAAGVTNVKFLKGMKSLNCSMLKSNEALISNPFTMRLIMGKECYVPKQPIMSLMPMVIETRRNWPILKKFNDVYFRLFESGLFDFIKKRSKNITLIVEKQELADYEVLTMDHMEYVFYVYAILNIFATIVFIIELILIK